MRIGIGAQPFGAFADIFQVIAHDPPVAVDEHLEKTAISLRALDESSLHVIHGMNVDDLLKGASKNLCRAPIAALAGALNPHALLVRSSSLAPGSRKALFGSALKKVVVFSLQALTFIAHTVPSLFRFVAGLGFFQVTGSLSAAFIISRNR